MSNEISRKIEDALGCYAERILLELSKHGLSVTDSMPFGKGCALGPIGTEREALAKVLAETGGYPDPRPGSGSV